LAHRALNGSETRLLKKSEKSEREWKVEKEVFWHFEDDQHKTFSGQIWLQIQKKGNYSADCSKQNDKQTNKQKIIMFEVVSPQDTR
jgi:hypothetical protein